MFLLKGDIFIGQPNFKCFGQKQCFLRSFYFPDGPFVVTPCAATCIPGHRGVRWVAITHFAPEGQNNLPGTLTSQSKFEQPLIYSVKRSLFISINEKAESNLELIWLRFSPSVVLCKLLSELFKKYSLAAALYNNSLHFFLWIS